MERQWQIYFVLIAIRLFWYSLDVEFFILREAKLISLKLDRHSYVFACLIQAPVRHYFLVYVPSRRTELS